MARNNARQTTRNASQDGKSGQGAGKSPGPSPPSANGAADTPTAEAPSTTKEISVLSPDEQRAVDELYEAMKQTYTTLGNTFDDLGKQTVAVASITARVAAARELEQAGERLRERQKGQEARLEELKKVLAANVEEQREKVLNKMTEETVVEIVTREVPARVKIQVDEQLKKLLSSDIKKQLETYKRRILEVRVSLYNSEARRKNALIRGYPFGEQPLAPLMAQLAPGQTSAPKPPALLPKTIGDLFQLNTQQISSLLKEYEIEECKEAVAASPLSPGGAAREENLNRLMTFLGVGLFVIPPLSATAENGEGGFKSPVVSRHYAWPSA